MNIDTKLTRLLGIKYPIIQGGMVWTSGADLASAVSNSGGLGVLGAGSMYPCLLYTSPSPRDLSTSRMPSSA